MKEIHLEGIRAPILGNRHVVADRLKDLKSISHHIDFNNCTLSFLFTLTKTCSMFIPDDTPDSDIEG